MSAIRAGDLAWFREGDTFEQVEVLKVLTPEDVDPAREWGQWERMNFRGYRLRVTIGEGIGSEFEVWSAYAGGWSLEKEREPFIVLPEDNPFPETSP